MLTNYCEKWKTNVKNYCPTIKAALEKDIQWAQIRKSYTNYEKQAAMQHILYISNCTGG